VKLAQEESNRILPVLAVPSPREMWLYREMASVEAFESKACRGPAGDMEPEYCTSCRCYNRF
jgi:hypothetical protein